MAVQHPRRQPHRLLKRTRGAGSQRVNSSRKYSATPPNHYQTPADAETNACDSLYSHIHFAVKAGAGVRLPELDDGVSVSVNASSRVRSAADERFQDPPRRDAQNVARDVS